MKKHLFLLFLMLSVSFVYAQFFAPETIITSYPNNGHAEYFDADLDGDLDVIQVDFFSGLGVRVYYREGDFYHDVEFPPIGGAPGNFADLKGYADLDSDGDHDIFNGYGWVENEAGAFNVFHYFLPEQHYGEGASSSDVNGDGHFDIVLSNARRGDNGLAYHLAVLINDGVGGFSEISNYTENPIGVAFGDVNHDGHVDMYYYYSVNALWYVYPGNGDGTFDAVTTLFMNQFGGHFSDYNHDGWLDFAYLSNDLPSYSGDLYVLYGQENGGYVAFAEAHLNTWNTSWGFTEYLNMLDYDGDGDLDILMRQRGDIFWFENDGLNTFSFRGLIGIIEGYVTSHIWTDLNSDQRLDLLVSGSTLVGHVQNEENILQASLSSCNSGCLSSRIFNMVDIDDDGENEMLTIVDGGYCVVNKVNQFNFVSPQVIAHNGGNSFWNLIDYDKDGKKDLFTRQYGAQQMLRQRDNLTFDLPVPVLDDIPGIPFSIGEFDIDEDGITDLLVATTNGANEVYWLKHNGGIDWVNQGVLAQIGAPGLYDANVKVFNQGDFNGDGLLDLAALTSNTCTYLLRNGSGTFDVQQVFVVADANDVFISSKDMVADVNLDGRDDLVFFQISQVNISKKFYSVRYDGAVFQSIMIHSFNFDNYLNGYSPLPSWMLADIDADGDDDILYTIEDKIKRTINGVIGYSSGQFLNITAQADILSIATHDIDGDVMPDLLFSSYYGASGGYVQSSINNLDSPYQIDITAFIDYNGDGIKNGFDEALINQQIAISGDWGYAFTDDEGLYTVFAVEGEYTLTMNINEDLWTPVTPFIQNVTLTESNPTASLVFAITPNSIIYDVQGHIQTMANVCGSDYGHWISIYNAGNTVASGTVTYTLAEGFTYTWGSPEPTSVNGNVITWDYTSLDFNESNTYTITAASPGVESIGSIVSHQLEVTALDGNGNLMSTSFDDNTYVIECAYDPNDIVENLGWSAPGYIKEDGQLEYTIRFQNLGNAPANDVRIENELSSLLNHNSVIPIASSHNYTVSQNAEGILNFYFPDINLPAAEDDEPGSHGFITFRINPSNGLLPNTQIVHHANIYFDLNPPIVTNEALNTILDCESIEMNLPSSVCVNDEFVATTDRIEFVDYNWFVDDNEVANGMITSIGLDNDGTRMIRLEISNPICSISAEQSVDVLPQPTIEFLTNDAVICSSEVVLEVSGTGDAEWSLNGDIVGFEESIPVQNPGVYIVRLSNTCGFVEDEVLVSQGEQAALESVSDDQIVCDDEVALSAAGVGNLSWWNDDLLLASGNELLTDVAGVYRVEATTSCGTISQNVMLSQGYLPEFLAVEENVSFCDEVGMIGATGTDDIVWYVGDEEIGVGSELDIDSPGDYRAVMSNECGVTERTIHVELAESPMFSVIPDDQLLCDESIELSADGNGAIHWYYNESMFADGGSALISNSGIYVLVVETACGEATHELNIFEGSLPEFLEVEENIAFCDEVGVIGATGTDDIVWYVGDEEIGVGSELDIDSPGDYRAVMSNECGVAERTIHVELAESPMFSVIPDDQLLCDESIVLSADGNGAIHWYYNESMFADGGSALISNSGIYVLVVETACGEATHELNIFEGSLPEFLAVEENVSFCDEVGMIGATGTDDIVWYVGDEEIGVGSELDIDLPGDYRAVMSNECGLVEQMIHVELLESPVFSMLPEDQTICQEPVEVTAEGNGNVQWFYDETNIAEGNTVLLSESGTYRIEIASFCGVATHELNLIGGTLPTFSEWDELIEFCDEVGVITANGTGNIVWFNGDVEIGSGNMLDVNEPGNYRAELTNECGTTEQTVSVVLAELPEFSTTFDDVLMCGEPFTLYAEGNGDVFWYHEETYLGAGYEILTSLTGTFFVELSNECGATIETQIVVEGVLPEFTSYSTEAALCDGVSLLFAEGNGEIIWFYGENYLSSASSVEVENTGFYSAILSTECGIEIIEVEVQPAVIPQFDVLPTDVETCQSEVLLEATASASDDMILWYVNGNEMGMGEEFLMTSSNIVEVVVDNGCATLTEPVSVILNSDPVVELSWDSDAQLVVATEGFVTYQWSVNGVVVAVNDSNTFSPEGDNVSVIVSDENGCNALASIVISAVGDFVLNKFSCYPNPTSDDLWINTSSNLTNNELSIFDAFGNIVRIERLIPGALNKVDVTDLSSGVYTLVMDNLVEKVVVQ